MNKFFYVLLTISMSLLSISGIWSFLNNKCVTFKRGTIVSSVLCGNILLIFSIVLLLISAYFVYLLFRSKVKEDLPDSEDRIL